MPLNLITTPWLPVRRLSGERVWIRPGDITSGFAADPIIALDFPRPDWNAAVTELLIGLLACVMAPEDDEEWAAIWAEPPSPEQLNERLAPLAFAFNLGGDGPRCFQDHDPLENGDETPVSALLIEAPSEDSSKNTDLFIKQGRASALSPVFTAAALITMQTYAPEGGRGHLASMRGGGPLTTLASVRRRQKDSGAVISTFWDLVWPNMPARSWVGDVPQPTSSVDPASWARIYPWLAPARSFAKGAVTLQDDPEHADNLQCFFGTPRRIRLDFSAAEGDRCALQGPVNGVLVRTYRRRPHGVKYEGWTHPLSPYRAQTGAGKIAVHPQSGGATYHDWLTWLMTPEDKMTQNAICVAAWGNRLSFAHACAAFSADHLTDAWQSHVVAWGFDMKKMKARAWLEARIPYFDPPEGTEPERWSNLFVATVKRLVAGAEEAGTALRYRTRLAKFGSCDRENGAYTLPKNSPGKNAYQDLYETFWRETESDFRETLARLRNDPADESMKVREDFLRALRGKALQLFDETAGTDDLADQDARRIVDARSRLGLAFSETGSVREALGILTADAQQKAAKRRNDKKRAAA